MSQKQSVCDNYLLSGQPVSLSFLKYQVVYQYAGGDKYIRSFNIIKDRKVVKKFYLKTKLLFDENTDIINVIQDILFKEMSCKNSGTGTESQKWQKPMHYDKKTGDARNAAASKLFTDMGL